MMLKIESHNYLSLLFLFILARACCSRDDRFYIEPGSSNPLYERYLFEEHGVMAAFKP
jgi:hypothetical protein